MRLPNIICLAAGALAVFTEVNDARASFHFMQIEQVIGGVYGDTSAQAIQLRMRTGGQYVVSMTKLVVVDGAGQNPVLILDLTHDVLNSALGDRVLIVSRNFTNYMSPSIAPDFILAQTIPTNYLAAGRLLYEDDLGTIYWSLSWGGASYTGSQSGSTVNDADGNFGPAVTVPLPSTDTRTLQFMGAASAASTANSANYALTSGTASFVNNARVSTTVAFRPRITAIVRETNNIRVTWMAAVGKTNMLQRSNSPLTNNFTDIFVLTNATAAVTNYLDVGAVTNATARFYRTRFLP